MESKREGNKVRQRIIRYLGAKPPTEEELKNILKEVNRWKEGGWRENDLEKEAQNENLGKDNLDNNSGNPII